MRRFLHLFAVIGLFGIAAGSLYYLENVDAQVAGELWSVEGPIIAIDSETKLMTSTGLTFRVPNDLVVDGTLGITGASLHLLQDANAPSAVRSISGGTAIAEGSFVNGEFVAETLFVELAENVIVGTASFDPAGNLFVNGVPVVLNQDERFGGSFLTVGGDPIDPTEVDIPAALAGTEVGAAGYYFAGALHAVAVETEFVPQNAGADTVQITRARGRNRDDNRSELEARGIVQPFTNATVITISSGGVTLGTADVVLDAVTGQGTWNFRRSDLPTAPTFITATSNFGGTHSAEVEVR